jgi:NAD(P)-dependent dehydrogenase (short-subunit alcohol dehydrogenase family)
MPQMNEHKVAIITGAAQGIGRRTAQLLAERGYTLALIDVKPPGDAALDVQARGADALELVGDVADATAVDGFAAAVRARWGGRADVLVNNAGISLIAGCEATTPEAYRRVLEVNLVAPFLLCRAFAPMMLAQRSGSIVNVASIAGLVGIADRVAYNASKHGLIGLTRTLAAEWGGHGVRVNAVCPGWVKTPMDDVDQARGIYSDTDITDRIPMARFATPDDVAHAIAFLSDAGESGFVNGHALVVDGGWTVDGGWQTLRLGHR